jgi:hypothetical protein
MVRKSGNFALSDVFGSVGLERWKPLPRPVGALAVVRARNHPQWFLRRLERCRNIPHDERDVGIRFDRAHGSGPTRLT